MAERESTDEKDDHLESVQVGEEKGQESEKTDGDSDEYQDSVQNIALIERLAMYVDRIPQPIKDASLTAYNLFRKFGKITYRLACKFSWVAFSTLLIFLGPLVIEYERNCYAKLEKSQQHMFGPGTVFTV